MAEQNKAVNREIGLAEKAVEQAKARLQRAKAKEADSSSCLRQSKGEMIFPLRCRECTTPLCTFVPMSIPKCGILMETKSQRAIPPHYCNIQIMKSEVLSRLRKYSEDLVHTEIMLPDNAPERYKDRGILWNAVEEAEKKSPKAQISRSYKASFVTYLHYIW